MEAFPIRIVIAALFTALLIYQTRRATPGSHRQRAFALAAIAIGLFLLVNTLIVFGITRASVTLPLTLVALLFLGGSLIFLGLAWRKGEMGEQVKQMQQEITKERERREHKD